MKNVFIVILVILVLCLGGCLVYDKVIDKDVKEEEKEKSSSPEEEYTLIEKNNESIQFLYSVRSVPAWNFDEVLYTTENLKIEDRTEEDKICMAYILVSKYKSYDYLNGNYETEVLENKYMKSAYERIFGPKTYTTPQKINCMFESYTYDANNNHFVLDSNGGGGANFYKIYESIEEVRKYNDRIEIKTSYCFQTIEKQGEAELNMLYYTDTESKNLIAKISENSDINIFEEYKDKMNHMTYTYKLGEDGFYYYYSSQKDK